MRVYQYLRSFDNYQLINQELSKIDFGHAHEEFTASHLNLRSKDFSPIDSLWNTGYVIRGKLFNESMSAEIPTVEINLIKFSQLKNDLVNPVKVYFGFYKEDQAKNPIANCIEPFFDRDLNYDKDQLMEIFWPYLAKAR